MTSLPKVSVVVPVLNGESTLGSCLHSLLTQDYPAEHREIIFVDNGSTDRTPEMLAEADVRVLMEPQRSPSRARNRGIEASQGEIVAFTDADCVASVSWLSELMAGFGSQGVGGVAGEILPFPPQTPAERYASKIRHLSPQRYLSRPIFPFAVMANLAFRSEVFSQVGLLDVSSPRGGESTDFCTRFFRVTGQRLAYAPRAAVMHRHRVSARDLFHQQWGYGRGHAYLYLKYRDELPWGWAEVRQVYGDLMRSLLRLGRESLRFVGHQSPQDDLHFAYFEFLRKLALRLGFAREAFARGHFLL